MCGGRLDAAHYWRKPRGGPDELGDESHGGWLRCAVDGCRFATDAAVAAVSRAEGVLRRGRGARGRDAAGRDEQRASRLSELLGVSRRTLARWRHWWAAAFRTSRFWQSLRNRFMPTVDEHALPLGLLDRFVDGDEIARLVALLRLLLPIRRRPGSSERFVMGIGDPQRMPVSAG